MDYERSAGGLVREIGLPELAQSTRVETTPETKKAKKVNPARQPGDTGDNALHTPSLASGRHKNARESIVNVISSQKSNDSHGAMNQKQRLAATAKQFGLDPEEAEIALSYAKAAKEATQAALTAMPEEAKHVKNIARWWSLTLDLCLRLKVAATLPRVLVDERQYHMADQLQATFKAIHKLEKTLFGEPRTAKDDLIKKAGGQTTAWWRTHKEPEHPKTSHSSSGGTEPTHLAA